MLRLNHNLWVWVKHYLGLNMTTKKPHSKRSRYQLVINWMGSSWLLGSSFLPRKRVHSVKWSTLFKMQHADANFGPAYTICSWKWTSWSKVVGNGFGSQLCPYRTNQPMNLPLLQSKWSVTQKKKKTSNGLIFMKNRLTSHSMLMLALNPMTRSSSSCPRKMSSPFPPESSKPSNPLNHC